jgi:hypothetical protein
VADEQEEAYLRALRRLEKEKTEKKNQQGMMGCLLFVIIAFAFVSCVNSFDSSSPTDTDRRASSSPSPSSSRLTDPTVAQWRAASSSARSQVVRTWTEALSPGMSSTQISARASELSDCINEAESAAPPEWKVRENLAATCAMMMGWR